MLGRRLITAAVLALCLLVPATAVAAGEEDEGAIGAFEVKGSNGYRILVLASRAPGKSKGQILMLVASGKGGVLYGTSASVEESGIRADLGELGRIDLEYVRLNGKDRYTCGSGGEVNWTERGEYRGVFELHGEEGYTEARATRVRGDERIFLDFICGEIVTSGEVTGSGLPGARLRTKHRRGSDTALAFTIIKDRPSAPAAIEISLRERSGKIHINRQLRATVPPGAFRYDPDLRTAMVSPPAPFDGSAIFRRDAPRRNRWSGDLTVDLPGRANTPLAQLGSQVSLVHAGSMRSRKEPVRRPTLGRPLALLEAP